MSKFEERIVIAAENQGKKLFGVLHMPLHEEKQKVPAVLFCHGLAGSKVGKNRMYVDLASQLSNRGIAALRFDYRGCGDSEGEFHEVTPSCHLSDALVFCEYLKQMEQIDSNRLGILGCSFGGVIAVKTAAQSEAFKSLVLWCPMFSGEQWREHWLVVQTLTLEEIQAQGLLQIENQLTNLQFFQEFFSINLLNDLTKLMDLPLLHIHGEMDTRVTVQHAENFESIRTESQGKNKFMRLPNTDHDYSNIEERLLAIDETSRWFASTL